MPKNDITHPHDDPFECGYCLVDGVPDFPATPEAQVANRANMRWLCDENLEMDREGGIADETGMDEQREDIAGESVHEDVGTNEEEDEE